MTPRNIRLALIAASVIGFGLFALFAAGVGPNESDRAILLALREASDLHDPVGPVWLEEAARDVTALGGMPILVLALASVALYLTLAGQARAAVLAVVTLVAAQIASEILKNLFDRPRPDIVPHEVAVYSESFPSGHAMISAAAFFTLAFALARVTKQHAARMSLYAIAAAFTFLVGLSRVYLGVHWPTDVAAGWCAGLAWALIADALMDRATPAPHR